VLLCCVATEVCPYIAAPRKLPSSPAQIFSKPNPIDLAESTVVLTLETLIKELFHFVGYERTKVCNS
jgi:hypothetical protein